jgi:type IV pilus assembly protein PilE
MKRTASGMTLIELMIVLVILAVLASIAIPSYRQYILRSHRVEAQAALLNVAAAQEKFYLQNNTYSDDLTTAPPNGLGIADFKPADGVQTENGWYEIAIVDADANGFSATATATAVDKQDSDTHCASFTIDHTGLKSATNDDCWK